MSETLGGEYGSGTGSRLPTAVLLTAGISALVAVLVSGMSIHLQLKNYRKPMLQRMVVRIMVMVPLYATSSLISLFSLEAAFVIDAIRDIYEAFVIYCFFVLLLSYLGGERSLLILLHGRPPKTPVFPVNIFKSEIDVSDPNVFLFLKRGILQYVQVKPVLAIATLILKAFGKFNEGDFRWDSGYLYVSIVYNTSICLSLYCLAMFWLCVNDDLKPFRPVPKFLCVKGILFFSFWQSIGISMLVAARVIQKLGPYTDSEHISLGLTDTLICLEMPFFAIAHMYAFAHTDYIDSSCSFVARMPMYYAFRDAFGLLDVVEDSKQTLRGEGMDYRDFEPSEGQMHQGIGRERRIRAGLRYTKGGSRKYWLPKPAEEGYAPLLSGSGEPTNNVVHLAPDMINEDEEETIWGEGNDGGGYDLPFGDVDDADEELFEHSKKYLFGDYNYPVIDVSSEVARTTMWDEEERILRDERGAWFSPIRGSKGLAALEHRDGPAWQGYGAVGSSTRSIGGGSGGAGKGRDKNSAYKEDREARRSPQQRHNAAVIDHEQNRAPSLSGSAADVKLGWTKNRSRPEQTPPLRTRPSGDLAEHHEGSEGSSSGGKNGIRSPPSISRSNSQQMADSHMLDSEDAVDLVVEDDKAALKEMTRERRKGEPAVRGSALRKVYKTTVVEDDGERRLVDAVDYGDAPGDRQDEDLDEVEGEGAQTPGTAEGTDGVVARTVEPPSVVVLTPLEEDDSNPWA